YVASVGIPKDYRSFGFDDPRHLATLDPALSFVEEQTRATAPERKLLSPTARLNLRLMARWPSLLRHGVWVLRYRFCPSPAASVGTGTDTHAGTDTDADAKAAAHPAPACN